MIVIVWISAGLIEFVSKNLMLIVGTGWCDHFIQDSTKNRICPCPLNEMMIEGGSSVFNAQNACQEYCQNSQLTCNIHSGHQLFHQV